MIDFRFAQFFIAPLFTADVTDREMNAVDSGTSSSPPCEINTLIFFLCSENAKNLQADGWRQHQLLKSSADPRHPFSKFGSGNLYTLSEVPKAKGIDIRAELLNFHSTYYSANVMKLVVLGRGE